MNYTLNQLNIYATVSRLGSITKAAEELNLTQPAVSIQLKNFQDQFDIPLTEVVGRKLFITDFGEEIAVISEKILEDVKDIDYRASLYRGEVAGTLTLSIVSTGKYIMPYFLTEFLKENPKVELRMDVTNKAAVVRSLEENQVDFSLVSLLPERLKLNSLPLMQNKLFLVRSPLLRLREGSSKKKKSFLEDVDLVFREQGSGTRQTVEKFIQQNNLKVHQKLKLTSNEAVKQAVIAGLGYAVMPLIGIKNELKQGDLEIVNISGLPVASQWQLIWLQGKKLSPAASAYLKYLESNYQDIVHEQFSWYESY